MPFLWVKNIISMHGKNPCEPIVKDDMELRQTFVRTSVKNKQNKGGMTWRESNKNDLLRMELPLRKLVTVLERRFEHITWTTLHVYFFEVRIRSLGMKIEINCCHHSSRGMRGMIVVVDTIVNCHRPKAGVSHVWQVKSSMNHDGTGFCEDCLGSMFCNSIFMMSTNAAEIYVLKALFNFINESLSSNDSIVWIEQLH